MAVFRPGKNISKQVAAVWLFRCEFFELFSTRFFRASQAIQVHVRSEGNRLDGNQ